MVAQSAEDPWDPVAIVHDLPEAERALFLRQYHEAVDAAHDPAGYKRLRQLLHVWSLAAIAANQPGYYEEIAAVRSGTARTVPISEVAPDWTARLAGRSRNS